MEKISVALLVLTILSAGTLSNGQRRQIAKTTYRFTPNSNNIFRNEDDTVVEELPEADAKETPAEPVQQQQTVSVRDCVKAGFFAYPGDCTRFYRCVSWAGRDLPPFSIFTFNCGPRTVFNPEISVCDHPWAVRNCGQPAIIEPPEGKDVTDPSTPIDGNPEPIGNDITTTTPSNLVDSTTTTGEDLSTTTPSIPVTFTTAPDAETTTISDLGSDGTNVPSPDGTTDNDDDKDDDDDNDGDGDSTTTGTTSTSTKKPGVFTLVCYDDEKYRRHPLYCNQYYYCIFANGVWDVPRFTCPESLVFDEDEQVCQRPEDDDEGCNYAPTKPGSSEPNVTTTTSAPPEDTTKKVWEVDDESLYDCPAKGYFPYEGDCIRFYKCVETEEGKLKGLLYRCPEDYGYSEAERFCELSEKLPVCQRLPQEEHLRFESATIVYPDDLIWFFTDNKK